LNQTNQYITFESIPRICMFGDYFCIVYLCFLNLYLGVLGIYSKIQYFNITHSNLERKKKKNLLTRYYYLRDNQEGVIYVYNLALRVKFRFPN
jgi:hypothetical protein